jgi:hypothetical protein
MFVPAFQLAFPAEKPKVGKQLIFQLAFGTLKNKLLKK